MPTFRVDLVEYDSVTVEAEDEDEAIEKALIFSALMFPEIEWVEELDG